MHARFLSFFSFRLGSDHVDSLPLERGAASGALKGGPCLGENRGGARDAEMVTTVEKVELFQHLHEADWAVVPLIIVVVIIVPEVLEVAESSNDNVKLSLLLLDNRLPPHHCVLFYFHSPFPYLWKRQGVFLHSGPREASSAFCFKGVDEAMDSLHIM